MLLLHHILKHIFFFTASLVFIVNVIRDDFNISPGSIITKFVFSVVFFWFLKMYFNILYESYNITTVNKITHMINAKWFLEKDRTVVIDLFEEDLKKIIINKKKLKTYTHTSIVRKLIEHLVSKESARKFRMEKVLDQKHYVYEKNGNKILLQKDKLKINGNIIGEFSLFKISDNDVKRYYKKQQFYKVIIYISNNIDYDI